jgi:chromate transporter
LRFDKNLIGFAPRGLQAMKDQKSGLVPLISARESFSVWSRVAVLSFGGPAGQIAVMHRILVEEKKWISEARFLHALNYCMLLPGPEAQQLATYIGWLLRGYPGGLLAGGLFVLPGFLSILALSMVYVLYRNAFFLEALFFGLKPAVIAIVFAALVKIASKALKTRAMVWTAALSFLALAAFTVPFPLVILAAAAAGFLGGHYFPKQYDVIKGHSVAGDPPDEEQDLISRLRPAQIRPPALHSIKLLLLFLAVWLLPLVALHTSLGGENVFTQIGIFFSKAAVVTFGGAYALLAYLAQQAVHHFHWLQPQEMMDGLGMAETTPGPLIQVTQFVGFMGAYGAAVQNPAGMPSPLMAGVLASVLTTWVTYVPCFLWIFLGAPYIEFLRGYKKLTYALSSITAAVVGVILNLGLWFSLHVLFKSVFAFEKGPLHITLPEWNSLDFQAFFLTAIACLLTFKFKWGLFRIIASTVILSFALKLLM